MRPEDLEEAARLLREGRATPDEVARTLIAGTPAAYDRTRAADGAVAGEPVPAVPRSFGKYEVLGEVARGGMGIVYRAHEPRLNRVVALKVLLAGEGASEEQIRRFTTEARAAAALQHPGIVQIFDVGEERGVHYFAMEYVDGIALDGLLKRDGPMEPAQALRVVREVARALQFAHENGIIHRDVKPGNILLSARAESADGLERSSEGAQKREGVKLSDFGLAKDLSAAGSMTISGNLLGTPGYMSPEQAAGRISEVDAQSDVFSLGAVAYHALTGEMPFGGATLADVLHNIRTTDPRPMRTLRAGLHRDVEIVVLKALAREKERRYRTAGEFADDIERYLRGEAIHAVPPSLLYRVSRFVRRNRAGVLAACVGAAAVAAAAGWSLWKGLEAKVQRLEKARGHVADARGAAKDGRFDDAYIALGLADALEPGLPEAVSTRRETRFAHAGSQVDAMAVKGNWEGAEAVLSAFADVRDHPGYAGLARKIAGTATLSVETTEAGLEVDLGTCTPGVVWDEETFPDLESARAIGLCSRAAAAPFSRRDVPFGDHMVVLSTGGRVVRLVFVRVARSEDVLLEHRVRRFDTPGTVDFAGVRPGNTIELGSGEWQLPVLTIPGLLIRAAGGAKPVLTPPPDRGTAVAADRAHGLSVRGVSIEPGRTAKSRGFSVAGTFRFSLAHVSLRGMAGHGVRLERCEDWLARDVVMRDIGGIGFEEAESPRGLALGVDIDGASWTAFQFGSPGNRAILCRAAHGRRCGFHSQAADTRFDACVASECPEMGIAVEEAPGQIVRDCLVVRCGTEQKIGTSGGILAANSERARVTHNTVFGGAAHGLFVQLGGGTFEDNLVCSVRPGMAFRWFCWGGRLEHALAWDCGAFAGVVQHKLATLQDLRDGQASGEVEMKRVLRAAIEADPKFVAPAVDDFRLAEGSPARGAASDGGDLGVRWDRVDELRRRGAGVITLENAACYARLAAESAAGSKQRARDLLARAKALVPDAPGIAEAEKAIGE